MKKVLVPAAAAFALAACFALVWLNPARAGAWLLGRSVAYPSTFASARFTGAAEIEYLSLAVDHPSAHFSSERAAVRLAPTPAVPGRITGRFDGVAIEPHRAGLDEQVTFASGEFAYESRGTERRIVFDGWTSPDLEFAGSLVLDLRDRPTAVDLAGRIRLGRWKRLLPGSDDAEQPPADDPMRPFSVILREGFLEVKLDGNTVFRSRWTLKK